MNDDLLVEFGLVDNDNDAVHDNQNTPFGAGDGIVADNDGAVDTRAGASTTVHTYIYLKYWGKWEILSSLSQYHS